MIQLRPHRCARNAPTAMRRRTVEADTPRYAAASRTENSGLGKNAMRLLVVLDDFDMRPTPSPTSVGILDDPPVRPAPPPHCDTSHHQRASARWHISHGFPCFATYAEQARSLQ